LRDHETRAWKERKRKTTLDHKYQIFPNLYEAKNRGGSNRLHHLVSEQEDGWERKRKSRVSCSDAQRYAKPPKASRRSYKHVVGAAPVFSPHTNLKKL
jgi:hypothetical protein